MLSLGLGLTGVFPAVYAYDLVSEGLAKVRSWKAAFKENSDLKEQVRQLRQGAENAPRGRTLQDILAGPEADAGELRRQLEAARAEASYHKLALDKVMETLRKSKAESLKAKKLEDLVDTTEALRIEILKLADEHVERADKMLGKTPNDIIQAVSASMAQNAILARKYSDALAPRVLAVKSRFEGWNIKHKELDTSIRSGVKNVQDMRRIAEILGALSITLKERA